MITSDINLGRKGRYWSRSVTPKGTVVRRVPCVVAESCVGCVGFEDQGRQGDCSMECSFGASDRIESIFIPLEVTQEQFNGVLAIARIEAWADSDYDHEAVAEDIPWQWRKDKDET